MKIKFKAVLTVITFLTAVGAGSVCSAQNFPIVGGYKSVSTSDETAVNVADFAVRTQQQKDPTLKFLSIINAERQIVAGSNYRFCLAVESGAKPAQASAVVYQNLQNVFSVTSWTPGPCGKPESETKENEAGDEPSTYKGTLEFGKTISSIVYLGEGSGDLAAFCFPNVSKVGRAILAACKKGQQCEFTGKIDYEAVCKIKDERDFSAHGVIVSLISVKAVLGKMSVVDTLAVAPEVLVADLYKNQKGETGPFFQTDSRAAVDKYFTKDFADLIWKDAVSSKGEVGAIDSDPLFNAQDTKITFFKIGTQVMDTVSGVTTVLVTFKNYGKSNSVKFLLEHGAGKDWKISDIVYKNGDMLKGILTSALNRDTK